MSPFLQFVAITALGLVTTWIVHLWFGLLENRHIAFAIWIAVCLAYGFIYDRWQARKRRDMQAGRLLD